MSERHRKELAGTVTSDKMAKTAIVEVVRLVQHPVYRKVVKKWKKYAAHDEKKVSKTGDRVRIQETKPLSKTKRWQVVEVLR
jgi:small subunit ribosomal protein S17